LKSYVPFNLPELLEKEIEAFCDAGKEDLTRVHGADGLSKIRDDTKKFYPRYARLGDKLVKNFVQFLKAY
jgi:hypothetical protein